MKLREKCDNAAKRRIKSVEVGILNVQQGEAPQRRSLRLAGLHAYPPLLRTEAGTKSMGQTTSWYRHF